MPWLEGSTAQPGFAEIGGRALANNQMPLIHLRKGQRVHFCTGPIDVTSAQLAYRTARVSLHGSPLAWRVRARGTYRIRLTIAGRPATDAPTATHTYFARLRVR
jgi:hypothetical protein